MISPIRKRCPVCKATDIYRRVTLKDIIAKSRYTRKDRRTPSKIYHCYICGHEFDSPFIGPKK